VDHFSILVCGECTLRVLSLDSSSRCDCVLFSQHCLLCFRSFFRLELFCAVWDVPSLALLRCLLMELISTLEIYQTVLLQTPQELQQLEGQRHQHMSLLQQMRNQRRLSRAQHQTWNREVQRHQLQERRRPTRQYQSHRNRRRPICSMLSKDNRRRLKNEIMRCRTHCTN
jgi:hypothetical protein